MSFRPTTQRAALLGGAALLVAIGAFALPRIRGGDRAGDSRPAAAPSAVETRMLGAHLLTASSPDEVQGGIRSLTEAAERGDADAQIALGRIYLQGTPAVPRDMTRAREWFMRAEPSRRASAAYFLGVLSQNGQAGKADPAEAARWFEIAANAGSPDAMFLLANAYRAGAGVPKSDAKAVELYRKAAEKEHPAALQALALAYLYGELGLEPDEAEHRRYMMAAEHAIKHHPGRATP